MNAEILFIDIIRERYGISAETTLYQYLVRKTKASDRGSKARKSLGNLYALYVLCEDYVAGEHQGSRFTDLLRRMRALPSGSKLQNHPLDNRLNDEIRRQYKVIDELLPVQPADLGDGQKARKISRDLLSEGSSDPEVMARFVIAVIDKYTSIIYDNQVAYLNELESVHTPDQAALLFGEALLATSDARLFEVVAFAILHIRYSKSKITFNADGEIHTETLTLYKTGRTNANDGGIDYVLRPLGRFFQVSETLDFKKYFLDFEKVNKFPITFVIKTDLDKVEVFQKLRFAAEAELEYALVDRYMQLIEDIITNVDLRELIADIAEDEQLAERCKSLVIQNFKLEFGLLD